MMHSRSLKLLLILSTALALALPSAASASRTMQVGISDEGVTQRNPALGAQVIPQWKSIGMDVSRVMIIWSYVAPDSEEVTQPAGFDPTNPNDPRYNWSAIDQTLAQLKASGIEPVVAVTGPGPIWASLDKTREDQRYRPDPAKFADFAAAAAKRYGSQVNRWLIWNEPNVSSWLLPQQECTAGKCVPVAPALYRSLVRAAYPAFRREDPGSTVLAGTLAPRGQTPTKSQSNVRPLAFLRAFACVDAKLRPERKSKYCKSGFKAPVADGFAYHPHGTLFAPTRSLPNKDEASLADFTTRLLPTLDGIQKRGRFLNAGSRTKKFDIYFTEYGYQTNPPDPYQGVSTTEQLNWAQQGAYLSWRQPRVKMLIQYLWRDDPVGDRGQGSKAYSGWQSGLYSFDGRKKPLRDAFPNPFWVDLPKGKKTATIWGQVRPGGATTVTVQKKIGSSWSAFRSVETDDNGYFAFTTTVPRKTSFRYRYSLDDAPSASNTVTASNKTYTSSVMTVKPKKK